MGSRPTLIILLYSVFIIIFFSSLLDHQIRYAAAQNATIVDVGVLLDLGSLPGKKNWVSISMAVDEFYAVTGNVSMRVVLHPRDSQGDIVGAALAAQDLVMDVKAQAVIGPMCSSETEFIANFANKSQVPVISFSATSPSLSSTRTPYFVRATLNDTSQIGAITSIVKLYGWREVALVYEDTEYGSGIVSSLIYALNSMDTHVRYCGVVPPLASDEWLAMELYRIMSMQTRVFVVHLMPDLGSRLFHQKFDAVVGGVPITKNWSMYVDFTLPYTDSGVSMIVTVKEDKNKKSPWIFFKPLAADLWLGSLAFFFFTGFVVWVTEHRTNEEFQGPPSQQLGTTLFFAFSTMVFAHKEKVKNNVTKFTVIVWLFVVQVLTSSYIASLTSMLTAQQLQPSVTEVSELINKGDYVGYQAGSFVGEMLKHQLNFDESKLRKYSTPEQYTEALSLGSENGGVSAIFDELPFLKLFLSDRCDDHAMVGEIYKTTGFGFVFPRGSPLVPDVSRAILKVTEKESVAWIEKKWFGDQITCPNGANSLTSSSLHLQSFRGLFLITGCVSSLALLYFLITSVYNKRDALKTLLFESSSWKRMVGWARGGNDRNDLNPHCVGNWPTGGSLGGSDHNDLIEGAISVISDSFDMGDGSSDGGRSTYELREPTLRGQVVQPAIELTGIRGEN